MLPATMRFYHRLRTNANSNHSYMSPKIAECTEAALPLVSRQPVTLRLDRLPTDEEHPILCRDLVVSGEARQVVHLAPAVGHNHPLYGFSIPLYGPSSSPPIPWWDWTVGRPVTSSRLPRLRLQLEPLGVASVLPVDPGVALSDHLGIYIPPADVDPSDRPYRSRSTSTTLARLPKARVPSAFLALLPNGCPFSGVSLSASPTLTCWPSTMRVKMSPSAMWTAFPLKNGAGECWRPCQQQEPVNDPSRSALHRR